MPELDPEFLPEPRRCKCARLLDGLGETDRSKFDVALADERASNQKIAAAFSRRGLTIDGQAVGLHRRDECCCP